VAGALEEAIVTGENTYLCDGGEEVGGWHISCNNVTGHGVGFETLYTFSCNDALMQIAKAEGAENFVKYQKIFGFGKSTGIDIYGEASTEGLLY
jgi:stage V sporulation protein D (sporulation-specific penicillin-binding protein)